MVNVENILMPLKANTTHMFSALLDWSCRTLVFPFALLKLVKEKAGLGPKYQTFQHNSFRSNACMALESNSK